MTDRQLQEQMLDSAQEVLLRDPVLVVAVAMHQPEVVQAEFAKHGWMLVPPGGDG